MTRGEIDRIRLPATRGREHVGSRFGVIVQADELQPYQLPLSRHIRSAAAATFRPEIGFRNERTRVLLEQLRAVDVTRLGEFAGRLTAAEQQAVDDALLLVLDLS